MHLQNVSTHKGVERFLSFNYADIHAISPMIYFFLYTTDIFRTKTDITKIFLEHEYIFCGYMSVNMIHEVISTANPFPDTARFMFVGVRHNKTQLVRY